MFKRLQRSDPVCCCYQISSLLVLDSFGGYRGNFQPTFACLCVTVQQPCPYAIHSLPDRPGLILSRMFGTREK